MWVEHVLKQMAKQCDGTTPEEVGQVTMASSVPHGLECN